MIDAFTGATERHIEVGDGLEIYVVLTSGGEPLSAELAQTLEALNASPLSLWPVLHPSPDVILQGGQIFVIRKELKKD